MKHCPTIRHRWFLPVILFASVSTVGIADDRSEDIRKTYERGWYLLSQIHVDKSGPDEALRLYSGVLESAPDDRDIYWKLSEMTFKKAEAQGNDAENREIYERALAYAKTARDRDPDSVEAHFWVGCCSAKIAEIIGNVRASLIVNQAIRELELIIRLAPQHRFAVTGAVILAAIYTDSPWPLKNLRKAERYGLDAVGKDPNLTIASVKLAKVYAQQKKFDRAREEALRCLGTVEPTYIWDAVLYNWPEAESLLEEIDRSR